MFCYTMYVIGRVLPKGVCGVANAHVVKIQTVACAGVGIFGCNQGGQLTAVKVVLHLQVKIARNHKVTSQLFAKIANVFIRRIRRRADSRNGR